MGLDTLKHYGELVLMGLGLVSAALHVVAPLTKSKKDDEAEKAVNAWTRKVADGLKWLVVPRKLNK